MGQHVIMLCSLDTKAREALFLKECLQEFGATPVLVDIGYGGPAHTSADIPADVIADRAGHTIGEIRSMQDTGAASALMMQGAIIQLNELSREGRCDGVVGFGGASNTTLVTGVMKTLPVGLPKLMISSAAALPAYAASYFGSRDITMMHALTDLSGLNELTRSILRQGAASISAMACHSGNVVDELKHGNLVAVTGFRFAEHCSQAVMRGLEEYGYNPIPFHAQGVGENAYEDLVASGIFKGVIDIVPAGLSEQMLGGNRAARPDRLEAAGKLGIPQVIAPSGFDMISCGPIERRDSGDELWEARSLAERKICVPDRYRVEARTTPEEVAAIGRLVAEKLNMARGPAAVFVPTRGWSSLSVEGADLYDPEADSRFLPALRETLAPEITVTEIDAELNSDGFAHALVTALHNMLKK